LLTPNTRRPRPGVHRPGMRPTRLASAPSAAAPVGTPQPAGGAPADGNAAPAAAPAAPRRRRIFRRNSASAGSDSNAWMILIGLIVVVGSLAAAGGWAHSRPSGDTAYFRAAVTFYNGLEKRFLTSPEQLRSELDRLPIGGVTDPKLKEFHSTLRKIFSLGAQQLSEEELERRLTALCMRIDKLVNELNARYAR
jgi:hypothetical protein